MQYTLGKRIILDLGGSIMFPDTLDLSFLSEFKRFVTEQVEREKRSFVIVAGGGRVCRMYQEAALVLGITSDAERDWIGIQTTRCNAYLVKALFGPLADPEVIDRRGRRSLKYPVTVACGWTPGWSTDFVAAALAADLKVKEMIIWGKPTHVFDKDPRTHAEAKPFEALSWGEYRKLVPQEWKPGSHMPVDPIAAREAEKAGVRCLIIGPELTNARALLAGEESRGTIIG